LLSFSFSTFNLGSCLTLLEGKKWWWWDDSCQKKKKRKLSFLGEAPSCAYRVKKSFFCLDFFHPLPVSH